jgi:hypothetical protein
MINPERVRRYQQAFWNGALKIGMKPTPELIRLCGAKALQACAALRSLDRTDDIKLPQYFDKSATPIR